MRDLLLCYFLMVVQSIPATSQSGTGKLNWELAYASSLNGKAGNWVPASVPGAVQLDIAKAKQYPMPFYFGERWKDYLWMEDQYYSYRTRFSKPVLKSKERLVFVSKGIDYEFEILLNGKKLFHQEGMFTWVRLDLTDYLTSRNELIVKVFPAPKRYAAPADRGQALYTVKPAISYGGDWHPRLIPLGIWDDTYLEIQSTSYMQNIRSEYSLSDDLTAANIDLQINGSNLRECNYSWTLQDASGAAVLKSAGKLAKETFSKKITFNSPKLWYTHDHGTPYLYTATTRLFDAQGKLLQTSTSRIGFRKIKLVMNEGTWDEPAGYPKMRSAPPIQVELNGRKIFCKGSNWVNPEIFPGTITRERYDELLTLAKEANFNIIRAWGGAIVNKESFFELCDEKGILVWQEFPLVCNNYPDDPHYLSVLEQEARSIILRVKKHPSLLLWSGGNELFNAWSGMTDQALALRLLNSLCLKYDAGTPFLPTSPLMGMGHGHYVFRDWDSREEVFQLMPRSHFTAYIEFGMPSPAPVEVLKSIIPAEELWPPKPGNSWQSHHAFKAWIRDTWLCQDIIEDYFGTSQSLEQLVNNGQLLQSEGFKCIYEEARRQKPYCSMALNWCFNEPWPTAANNSQISYPNVLKPAYGAVKQACRPFMASARFPKFKWKAGESFTASAWILNDLPSGSLPGKLTLSIVVGEEKQTILTWDYGAAEPNVNLQGPVARFTLPSWNTERFKVIVEVVGHPEYTSEYHLLYQPIIGK